MGETEGSSAAPRPTITIPPRAPFDTLFAGGSLPAFSPGPMTLVSSFFAEQYPDSECRSFSQLLAGAMASPAVKPGSSGGVIDYGEGRENRLLGYKQNRPVNLVVAHSPLFMVPPGLSPSGLLNSPGFLSPLQSPFGMSHQQALAHVTAQAALSQSYMQMQAEYQNFSQAPAAEALEHNSCPAQNETLQQTGALPSDATNLKFDSQEVTQLDGKSASVALDKPDADGYNWRKYGQKLVKASEHPRSYYKCTYINCPVKKKVERSVDGQIREITYKGQHNHDLPRPSKRQKGATALNESLNTLVRPEPGAECLTQMNRSSEARPSLIGKDLASTQLSHEQPLTSEHDEVEDTAIVIDEGDDHEPSEKRSIEIGAPAEDSSHKTVTEPRIVVQTQSEVDLLDDGYKWRKYGQKVVKGNPHPRSYYRCTYVGCNVRKHVERASTDPKAVITTYEGKHNHDIPTGRNSSHSKANSGAPPLKKPRTVTGKPSQHVVVCENTDQILVFPQLKEEQVAA